MGQGGARRLLQITALAGWKLIRPIARPVIWRLRGFFTNPVLGEVTALRADLETMLQTAMAASAGLAASGPAVAPGFATAPLLRRPRGAPTLRAVHQFHAGCATADAITNAMFLLRTRLRAAGYRSDIFVENPGPDLADELLPIDALPRHGEYVLIVRHSMGHAYFERLAALPAPKILHYHNITPPDLLAEPEMAEAAREGRRQLVAWRDRVVAATADSAFNALELRALGYDVVLECPLLVDVPALRAAAAAALARDPAAPFTVLFVGRLTESKGQAELIEAFAAFRAAFGAPCRLCLPGRGNPAALRQRADGLGLGAAVELPGVVSDAGLHAAYAGADLYVSLSQHEGFGVPLVEAMAHGLPVLAWPAGAVAHTLAGAGELLASCDPQDVAAAMLALARDPARRAALAAAGRRRLEDFALENAWPTLQSALALAGAAPPVPAGVHETLAANLHLTVAGHANSLYSLAQVNRRMVLAMEAARPGHARLLPFEDGRPAKLTDVPPAERPLLERLAARPVPPGGPEVVLSQHWPVLLPSHRGDLPLAMVFWEESLIPAEMADRLNRFAGVLAPAPSVARALIDSGVRAPVATVGYAPDLAAYAALAAARRPPEGRPFTVLHVSSGFPRKGVDLLLEAWAAAFTAADDVRLVLKTFPNPHNDIAARLATLREHHPDLAPVELIDADLTPDALLDLYRHADAMVLPTRGEGFNLPAAEAIAAGLPLVVTGWGGQMDFCVLPGAARLLRYRLVPSASHVAAPGALWAEPDAADLVAALRALPAQAADPEAIAARAKARAAVLARLDPVAWLDRLSGVAADLLLAPPPRPLRVAWISSWRVACGIATYSRALLDAFPENPAFATRYPTVLCDTRSWADSDPLKRRALISWKISPQTDAFELASAVSAEDPDVLVIQHQPALIGWIALSELLGHPAVRGRLVVVTLHNTRDLATQPAPERARAVTALGGAARLLVHTTADLEVLRGLGLQERATLLPHGLPAGRPPAPVRPLPAEAAPLLGCHGFVLPGKGMAELVEALALLRQTWPGARLRMVTAQSATAASRRELAACQALAGRLGVAGAIAWHTDFLAPDRALDLLAECDAVVLPYTASQESASGALRLAVASGVPVATTDLPLFVDAGAAVWRLPGASPQAIAAGLTTLLRQPKVRAAVQAAAQDWLAREGWEKIGPRLQALLLALARAHPGAR